MTACRWNVAIVAAAGAGLALWSSSTAVAQTQDAPTQYEERPNRIRIEYVPPTNPAHQKLYEFIRERQVLETVQKIFSPFRLPLEVTIKTIGCDGVKINRKSTRLNSSHLGI